MKIIQKILAVDDKKENLFALEKVLRKIDAEVIKATSGNDALKSTLNHEFALAILDVQMPGMDGYELAEFLRSEERTRHLPIIFVSAVHSDDYYVFKGYEAGAVDYIVKPYNPKVLSSKVSVFLRLDRQKKELLKYQQHLEDLVKQRTARLVNANENLKQEIDARKREEEKRRESQEALRRSEEFSKKIIESSHDCIKTLDLEGRLEFMSLGGQKLMEIEDIGLYLNQSWIDFWKDSDRKAALEAVSKAGAGETTSFQGYCPTEKGVPKWWDIIITPIQDEDGGVERLLSISRDITRGREAKEALRKSEARFRELFNNMNSGVAVYEARNEGEQFIFKDLNRGAERIEQVKKEKIIGKDVLEVFPGVKDLGLLDIFHRVWKTGRAEFYPAGFYRDERIAGWRENYVYKLESGEIVTVYDDVTERKTQEEERLKLETQLQQAQKMEAIGTLAGGIAHDFNNILGAIIGYAELAKMKAPQESNVVTDLNQVIKSSNRAADLVHQILTVSRRHKKERQPLQLKYIAKETLKMLRATLPTTIEIKQDMGKDSGIVNADPTQMHQVIMNLCTNAGHAMQADGGVLTLELADVKLDDIEAAGHLDMNPGPYLRLKVSDSGHGMGPEIVERIFDPYFTTKDTGEGTGLGLSVAQGIVKAHGGTITVYSEPGKGTTFHVYLPVIQKEEREEKDPEGPLPTGSGRILFIDDEQTLVEIGSQMLERLGYEVVTQKSSTAALELFRAEPDRFDLVITDMTMPRMTGDKLAQELMKIRSDIPIILCTGHSKLVSEEKVKEMGIRAFVMKPLVMRNLAESVRTALGD